MSAHHTKMDKCSLAQRYQSCGWSIFEYIFSFMFHTTETKFNHFQVVHSVHGIMFKDLKQILRKEQCDASILLTANVPSAKKIIVHGPQGKIFLIKHLFFERA